MIYAKHFGLQISPWMTRLATLLDSALVFFFRLFIFVNKYFEHSFVTKYQTFLANFDSSQNKSIFAYKYFQHLQITLSSFNFICITLSAFLAL